MKFNNIIIKCLTRKEQHIVELILHANKIYHYNKADFNLTVGAWIRIGSYDYAYVPPVRSGFLTFTQFLDLDT